MYVPMTNVVKSVFKENVIQANVFQSNVTLANA